MFVAEAVDFVEEFAFAAAGIYDMGVAVAERRHQQAALSIDNSVFSGTDCCLPFVRAKVVSSLFRCCLRFVRAKVGGSLFCCGNARLQRTFGHRAEVEDGAVVGNAEPGVGEDSQF